MSNWIGLQGLANLRDVGGIPTTDGAAIVTGRLLRSDNLQDLTPDDVADLRSRGLTDVIDLRSHVEVRGTGPGPLTVEPWITIHHHTMFVEDDPAAEPATSAAGQDPTPIDVTTDPDAAAAPAAALPWVGKRSSADHDDPVTAHYLSYMVDRPDSVLGALRAISTAPGAALVHCAAGKDRTGTIVALALLVADAEPEAVVADYAASNSRLERVVRRLSATPTYADNLRGRELGTHVSRPETMRAVIDRVQTEYGGVVPLLGRIGWTDTDTDTLRDKLRGEPV